MGRIWMPGGGGGADLDVVTAVAADVLSPKVIVGPDGEPITGTMPDNTTLTSNGTVPGISSSYPNTPSRTADNYSPQINTNTDGVKRISMCPPKGYYQGNAGSYISRPASDLGNAATNQVLSGTTFTSENGLKVTGTIPIKSAATYTPSTVAQTIAAGQYLSGAQTIDSLGGTATAAQVLSGYTFSSNNAGRAASGTIPIKSAATYTPSTVAQTIAAGQYLSGAQTIAPIPSGWYNAVQQAVFDYGSYGIASSLGAYFVRSGIPWVPLPSSPVGINSNNGMAISNGTDNHYVIFRAAFPPTLSHVRVTFQLVSGGSGGYARMFVLNPQTLMSAGSLSSAQLAGGVARVATFNATSLVGQIGGNWALALTLIHMNDYSSVNYGIFKVEISPTPFT